MTQIKYSHARAMAVARWGPDAHSCKTSRPRTYWFDCASHGGYIIPHSALSFEEIASIREYLPTEYGTAIVDNRTGRVRKFRGPDSFRTVRYHGDSQHAVEIPLFFGEEDCAWSVIEEFTDIRRLDAPADPPPTFWDWYDPRNPKVRDRIRQDEARAARDPDLIISACRVDGGVCVTTADSTNHILTSYDNSIRWLSEQPQ